MLAYLMCLLFGVGCIPEGTSNELMEVEITSNYLTGVATFQEYNADNDPADFPVSSQMYFRAYWDELEPQQGQVNTVAIEGVLAQADASGQRVGFRVMSDAGSGVRVPDWLAPQINGTIYTGDDGQPAFMPDPNDPVYLSAVESLLNGLGAAFDGDPRLEYVDIGLVGLTGEWHMNNTGAPLPTQANAERIIDAHRNAFPSTRLVMLIGSPFDDNGALTYALTQGAGWRGDCLGDSLYTPPGQWSHMGTFYPDKIATMPDAWQTAPVLFETCGHPADWFSGGVTPEQFDGVLNWALDRHVSLVNFREADIPVEFRPVLDEFLKKVGFQITAKPHTFANGILQAQFENFGVAPPYGFAVQYRVRSATGETQDSELLPQNSVDWLPGTIEFSQPIPIDIPAGNFIDARLLDLNGEPINLHNDQNPEGWVQVVET